METLIHLWNALPDAAHYAVMAALAHAHCLDAVARLLMVFGHALFEDGSIR